MKKCYFKTTMPETEYIDYDKLDQLVKKQIEDSISEHGAPEILREAISDVQQLCKNILTNKDAENLGTLKGRSLQEEVDKIKRPIYEKLRNSINECLQKLNNEELSNYLNQNGFMVASWVSTIIGYNYKWNLQCTSYTKN